MGFGTARILTNLILKILEILEIVEGGIIVFHYLFFILESLRLEVGRNWTILEKMWRNKIIWNHSEQSEFE